MVYLYFNYIYIYIKKLYNKNKQYHPYILQKFLWTTVFSKKFYWFKKKKFDKIKKT